MATILFEKVILSPVEQLRAPAHPVRIGAQVSYFIKSEVAARVAALFASLIAVAEMIAQILSGRFQIAFSFIRQTWNSSLIGLWNPDQLVALRQRLLMNPQQPIAPANGVAPVPNPAPPPVVAAPIVAPIPEVVLPINPVMNPQQPVAPANGGAPIPNPAPPPVVAAPIVAPIPELVLPLHPAGNVRDYVIRGYITPSKYKCALYRGNGNALHLLLKNEKVTLSKVDKTLKCIQGTLNDPDQNGRTALYRVIHKNEVGEEIVARLLEAGAVYLPQENEITADDIQHCWASSDERAKIMRAFLSNTATRLLTLQFLKREEHTGASKTDTRVATTLLIEDLETELRPMTASAIAAAVPSFSNLLPLATLIASYSTGNSRELELLSKRRDELMP